MTCGDEKTQIFSQDCEQCYRQQFSQGNYDLVI